jgi:hypothetical protein
MTVQNESPENEGTSGEQRANVQNAKAAEWVALAKWCEAETEPDRLLDYQILLALGWTAVGPDPDRLREDRDERKRREKEGEKS